MKSILILTMSLCVLKRNNLYPHLHVVMACRCFILIYMKAKCSVCKAELPVPTWKKCLLHDSLRKKIVTTPFVELREHDNPVVFMERRNRPLPKIILDKKIKPFKYYMGYEICIPFHFFLSAQTLITDNW